MFAYKGLNVRCMACILLFLCSWMPQVLIWRLTCWSGETAVGVGIIETCRNECLVKKKKIAKFMKLSDKEKLKV